MKLENCIQKTSITTGLVLVMGEVTTKGYVDVQNVVREIGYDRAKYEFDADTCGVIVVHVLDEQSIDIAMGVDCALEVKECVMLDDQIKVIGVGDQGMMFGYATNETEEYMLITISFAHKLIRQFTEVRKNRILPYLGPDGKVRLQ